MPRLEDAGPKVDEAVGRRVRLRRLLLGLTQEAVADGVGVTFQQLQKYENGTNRISASRLYRLSLLLKAPVNYFFEDLEPRVVPESDTPGANPFNASDPAFSRQGLKLLGAFARIQDAKTRKSVADLVDELADKGGEAHS